ncbi:MAG: C-terminal binding protein [Armatimonadota bacterium]
MAEAYRLCDTTGRIDYPLQALDALDAVDGLQLELKTVQLTEPDELLAECESADALLVAGAWVTREVMEGLPRLKVVVRYGVGMDRIDLQAAEELGVVAQNVRDFCTGEMADHCLGMLLACARNLCEYAKSSRQGLWGDGVDRPVSRLQGAIAGIVGFGAIGRALATRLSALEMNVLCYDPYIDADAAAAPGVKSVQLEDLLSQADFVSLNCALTDDTRQLIGAAELEAMKPTAFLINTSRGEVVDEAALIEALQQERIAGAALDVLQTEPPPKDHPLLQMERVLVTPHVAWYSEEAAEDVVVGAFEHLARLLPQFTPGAVRTSPAGPR